MYNSSFSLALSHSQFAFTARSVRRTALRLHQLSFVNRLAEINNMRDSPEEEAHWGTCFRSFSDAFLPPTRTAYVIKSAGTQLEQLNSENRFKATRRPTIRHNTLHSPSPYRGVPAPLPSPCVRCLLTQRRPRSPACQPCIKLVDMYSRCALLESQTKLNSNPRKTSPREQRFAGQSKPLTAENIIVGSPNGGTVKVSRHLR